MKCKKCKCKLKLERESVAFKVYKCKNGHTFVSYR